MVTVRSGSIDFFGSVKRMITRQDAQMWLAVTAAVGAVCLVLCRAGRMKNARPGRAAGILSGGDRYLHAGAPDSKTGV